MILFVRNALLIVLFRFDACLSYKPGGISDTLLSGSHLNVGISEQLNYNKDLSGKGEPSNHERQENSARYNKFYQIREGFNKDKYISGHIGMSNETDSSFPSHSTGHHKKEYHRVGFSNNYHQDESSNKTSLYEESEDAKERNSFDKNDGSYGTNLVTFKDDIRDTFFKEKNRVEKGNYNNCQRYDDTRGHNEKYQNNHPYDGGHKYLYDDVGQRYDGNWDYIRPYNYRYYPFAPENDFTSSNYPEYQVCAEPKFYSENIYITEYSRNHRYFPDYSNQRIHYPDDRYYDDGYRSHYYDSLLQGIWQ